MAKKKHDLDDLVPDGFKLPFWMLSEFIAMCDELGTDKSKRYRHLIEKDLRRHAKMKRAKAQSLRKAS